MKTGIWGAGNIAHTHAEALKASGVEIAAVVDVDEAKAKEFAETFGIEKYGRDPGTESKGIRRCVRHQL